jgi:hypothetical protein
MMASIRQYQDNTQIKVNITINSVIESTNLQRIVFFFPHDKDLFLAHDFVLESSPILPRSLSLRIVANFRQVYTL